MRSWAAVFLVIAMVAAALALSTTSVATAEIAKILFLVCLALFLVSGIASLAAHGPRRPLP